MRLVAGLVKFVVVLLAAELCHCKAHLLSATCGTSVEMSERFLKQFVPHSNYTQRSSLTPRQKLDRLSKEPILVRINLVYDDSLRAEFASIEDMFEALRNMMYDAQLAFERKNLASKLKVQLVVVRVIPSDLIDHHAKDVGVLLEKFDKSPDMSHFPAADLNLIVVSSQLPPMIDENTSSVTNPAGVAIVGSFCTRRSSSLVAVYQWPGSSQVIAHEIAHTLGSFHDAQDNNCPGNVDIMASVVGLGRTQWSSCSIDYMLRRLQYDPIFNCIYDKNRMASAKPITDSFDFRPGNPSRLMLPAQYSLDELCRMALGNDSVFLREARETVHACYNTVCVASGLFRFNLGAAPYGTNCTVSTNSNHYCPAGKCKY